MITIKDNNEKLVDIKKLCPGLVIDLYTPRPAYFRGTVAKMICKAKGNLPFGMTFILGDGWRSKELQQDIHKSFYRRFKNKHPHWNDEQINSEINEYVAPYEGDRVSGHMTGGAVDLRLSKNGRKVPMESSKLTYQENALSNQPKLPKYIRQNRQILFEVLTKAGLSNYPKEYWHWSYGDYWWAKRNNKKIAIYGEKKLS